MSEMYETISKKDCLKIGFLQKPCGVKGQVILSFRPGFGESLRKTGLLLTDIDGLLVPWFPEEIRFRTDDTAVVQLEWITDDLDAKSLCGLAVFIRKEDWIREEEEEWSLHELAGYTLYDEWKGRIGEVEQVNDYGGNILFEVNWQGKKILVPYHEDFVAGFDEVKRKIVLRCPEGIFDLE